MRIAVIGTGIVGRTLAPAFARLGHDTVVGSRDPSGTRDRDDWDLDLPLATVADAVTAADLVVNATNGAGSVSTFAGVDLSGKALLDVANPLDFSQGFPPTLLVQDTDSLAEQLQRAHPSARVVKSLNTVNCAVMVDPDRLGESTTMFLAGDDAGARALVQELLGELGWTDVIEFDALSAARGMEMWLPMWVRLVGALGTPDFNLSIIR